MKYHLAFRVLLAISSLLVITTLFLPLWEIYLWAPQYPEGLSVTIWHNDVKGDVDVINGLNHYIGMKHIKADMFPEFKILQYIIIAFVLYGLLVAYLGTVKSLKIFCTITLLGGIIALADFYRWGYDYGHNLDPTAPIQVPGMAYQPPVLGYKDLLNFTALSMPASGGWIIISVGAIAFAALFFHWFRLRKRKVTPILMMPLFCLTLNACQKGIPEINFGTDDCHFCQMKLMDNKFGLVAVTEKGKTYKFDDYHCYQKFTQENKATYQATYVVLFNQPGKLQLAESSFYVKGPSVKSPMGSNTAFFSQEAAINEWVAEKTQSGKFSDLKND